MKTKTDFQAVKEAYLEQLKNEARGQKTKGTMTVGELEPGKSYTFYDEIGSSFKATVKSIGRSGTDRIVKYTYDDNSYGKKGQTDEFKVSDGEKVFSESVARKQMKEQQVDEVRTMSARDLGKKIDSLEDVHQDIRMSMIDTISDISKRKKLETKLQKTYDQYFKVLAEIEKMLK